MIDESETVASPLTEQPSPPASWTLWLLTAYCLWIGVLSILALPLQIIKVLGWPESDGLLSAIKICGGATFNMSLPKLVVFNLLSHIFPIGIGLCFLSTARQFYKAAGYHAHGTSHERASRFSHLRTALSLLAVSLVCQLVGRIIGAVWQRVA